MEKAASWGIFGALQKMTDTFQNILPYLILLSFIAGVWIYYLLVSRHESQDQPLKTWVKAFLSFDWMFWPILGRVLYISLSVFLLLCGFITMFAVSLLGGLVGMTVLLVLVRILFEMMLVLFSMHEHLVKRSEPRTTSIIDVEDISEAEEALLKVYVPQSTTILGDENISDVEEALIKVYVPMLKNRFKEKSNINRKSMFGKENFSDDENILKKKGISKKENYLSDDLSKEEELQMKENFFEKMNRQRKSRTDYEFVLDDSDESDIIEDKKLDKNL